MNSCVEYDMILNQNVVMNDDPEESSRAEVQQDKICPCRLQQEQVFYRKMSEIPAKLPIPVFDHFKIRLPTLNISFEAIFY